MAINNRAEAIIVAEDTLVPTLTLIQHKTMLNDNILNSVKFDKDVIASQTPTAGAVTIDYATKDMATVTTAVDLAVSFTNLQNGAVKYLEVTKAAANVISFVGATDMSKNNNWILANTVIVYRILNKNSVIYCEALTPEYPNVYKKEIVNMGSIALAGNYLGGFISLPGMVGVTYDKIRSINAIIYRDDFARTYDYRYGGTIGTVGILLYIDFSLGDPRLEYATLSGGAFDNTFFNDAAISNRGVITIEYV
jgi:hypothetical protein